MSAAETIFDVVEKAYVTRRERLIKLVKDGEFSAASKLMLSELDAFRDLIFKLAVEEGYANEEVFAQWSEAQQLIPSPECSEPSRLKPARSNHHNHKLDCKCQMCVHERRIKEAKQLDKKLKKGVK